MTYNAYNAAASNNPTFAGQINQFLVDHNVQIFAYDGVATIFNTTTPTATCGTNTASTTGQPQYISQPFTPTTTFTMSRIGLSVSSAASGADVLVMIQPTSGGNPTGLTTATALAWAYLPKDWLTSSPSIISLPMTCILTGGTAYSMVVTSSASTVDYVEVGAAALTTVSPSPTVTLMASTSPDGVTWTAGATGVYFVIYDNTISGLVRGIQCDSGAYQTSATYGMCTANSVMNGLATTTATWTVDGGTQGFPATGTFFVPATNQVITYSAKTDTTFTYASGGSAATLATGDKIFVPGNGYQLTNAYAFTAYQPSVLGNLIVPPDDNFVAGIGSWQSGLNFSAPTVGQPPNGAYFGTQSLLCTTDSTSPAYIETGSYFAVTAGLSYALQAFVLAVTTPRPAAMEIVWLSDTGATVATSTGTPVGTSLTAWVNLQLIATAPVGAVNAQLVITFTSSGGASDPFYVNGVGFTQSSSIPNWSPGGLGVGQARTLTYTAGRLIGMV